MDNIYLASRYSRKEEMREVAASLSKYGITVTSSWLREDFSPTVNLAEITDEDNTRIAQKDLDDLIASDVLLFFAEDQKSQPPRGGRHVEFGYALAQAIKVFVIGGKENIFHYLPQVIHYATLQEFEAKELL